MARYEITHIQKPDRYSTVESIQQVYGPAFGIWSLGQAVHWAELYGNSFYVRGTMGAQVDVQVKPPKAYGGNKYLQTVSDYTQNNNLLSLPEITTAIKLAAR